MTLDFVHLHTRSWFSFLAGGSSPRTLAKRAAELGMNALALADLNGVYGTVRFQKACRTAGIHAVIGAEIITNEGVLILLARSQEGYRNLCRLLTASHLQNREAPIAGLDSLRQHREHLICLTGGRESRLWQLASKGAFSPAATWLEALSRIFGSRLYVELCHGLQPDDGAVVHRLYRLASVKYGHLVVRIPSVPGTRRPISRRKPSCAASSPTGKPSTIPPSSPGNAKST